MCGVVLVPERCEYLCRQGLNKHLYYPTQQNTSSRLSEEFKVFLWSVTKHYNFQERASGRGSETYQNFTSWNWVFMSIIPICAWYAQEPAKSPLQSGLPPPAETEYSLSSWKIPLGGPRPCPPIRNMLFLTVTEKITVWDFFFKRLKIQNES